MKLTRRRALAAAAAAPLALALPAISSPVAGIDIAHNAADHSEAALVQDMRERYRLIRFQFSTDLRYWLECNGQCRPAEPA